MYLLPEVPEVEAGQTQPQYGKLRDYPLNQGDFVFQIKPLQAEVSPNDWSKSGYGTTEVFVNFVNSTEKEISFYWVDGQGVEKFYYKLDPGADYIQHTYTTHVWVARDPYGKILNTFVANNGNLRPKVVIK